MKKFSRLIYFLIIALLIFSVSGCDRHKNNNWSDDNSNNNDNTQTVTSGKFMGIKAPSLFVGDSYKIYKGGTVSGTDAIYYVAPIEPDDDDITAAVNLGFSDTISADEALVITDSANNVVFAYNPDGIDDYDVTTNYGDVKISGGTQLKYTSLNLAGTAAASAIDIDDSDVVEIVLDGTTATIGGVSVPSYNYVWHADPQHADEYWTEGTDGTTEYDEDEIAEKITSSQGVYIAHDVRYISNTLSFTTSQTATKDEDKEYVVYYDESSEEVANAIAKITANTTEYGTNYGGPYVFACLPQSVNGMGGGGTPPDGEGPGNDGGTPPEAPDGGNPPSLPSANVSASDIAAFDTMTHSASDAYDNPVLHITKAGTYSISGTWNGQIWVDVGEDTDSKVNLILNGVTVKCTVAPALVFYEAYECGPDDEDTAASDWKTLGTDTVLDDAGVVVGIADGTTNTFTGANLYRMLKLKPKYKITDTDSDAVYKVDGTNISAQKKMYKLDAAFHSRVSMLVGSYGSAGTGTLSVTSSTYEGFDSEMHMTIDSGTINVTAPDDAINVNEDYISTFTMNNGTLTLSSTGGDGIDSNGYVVVNGGTLNITAGSQAQNSAGEAGIDAELDTYISDNATYNWSSAGSQNQNQNQDQQDQNQNQDQEQDGTDTDDGTDTTTELENKTFEATYGTVTINYDTAIDGFDSSAERTIPTASDVFTLELEVNNFGGLQAK